MGLDLNDLVNAIQWWTVLEDDLVLQVDYREDIPELKRAIKALFGEPGFVHSDKWKYGGKYVVFKSLDCIDQQEWQTYKFHQLFYISTEGGTKIGGKYIVPVVKLWKSAGVKTGEMVRIAVDSGYTQAQIAGLLYQSTCCI